MSDIKYIDCYASIGKWAEKDRDAPWTNERMLADMERCGIHGALVYSNFAKELQPSVGNDQVLETCRKNPRLIPCWVALPHHCGDAPEGKRFVERMIAEGVKAVKLFPRMHRYRLDDVTIGTLLGSMEEAGIPMIIDRAENDPNVEQISWDELERLLNRYPRLNIILHHVRWELSRMLLPLAHKYKRLHFEFSNYQANRIIDFMVEKIGADQLLFGTQMMDKSPGAAKAFVDYADISDTDRKKIAGGNLIRLLKLENIPPDYPEKNIDDKILLKAMNAEPIDDMEVIDAHAHHMKKDHHDNVIAFMPKSDAAGIVERNNRLGVDITITSSWTGIWSDYEEGNIITRDAIREFPEQIIGYASLDPRYVKEWSRELKLCYEEYGMKGMKPYFPRNKVPYNDPSYKEWYEYGNRHRLFALMHWSENFISEMEDLAKRYPKINFLLAHSGMLYETARNYVALAKQFKNIHLEITYTAVKNGIIEYMVDGVGSERVIYGSDTVMRDPYPQFGWVAYADISEAEKRNIFGMNMRKILDTCTI